MTHLDLLKKNISHARFYHGERVRIVAQKLAIHYHVSVANAIEASLYHDCARELSMDQLIDSAKKNGITINEHEKNYPVTLHAVVGSILARSMYGIAHPDVLSAIRNHSFGYPGMNILDQIIFIADFVSDDRIFPEAKDVRKVMYTDLDKACLLKCNYSIQWHKQKNMQNHPNILKYFNYLKAKQTC